MDRYEYHRNIITWCYRKPISFLIFIVSFILYVMCADQGCPSHLNSTTCKSCESTCASLRLPQTCTQVCNSGCQCPAGHYEEDNECVLEEQCGCAFEGKYYEVRIEFLSFCSNASFPKTSLKHRIRTASSYLAILVV